MLSTLDPQTATRLGTFALHSSFHRRGKVDGSQTTCPGEESKYELSSPGWRADLYSAFGIQRNLGDLRDKRPRKVFSATDSSRDNPKTPPKSDVLGVGTRTSLTMKTCWRREVDS